MKLLSPGAKQRKEGNSCHLQIQMPLLLDSAVQTDTQVQEEEEVDEASVLAEVEAAVEAFKLADHHQVMIQKILFSKVKTNSTKPSISSVQFSSAYLPFHTR